MNAFTALFCFMYQFKLLDVNCHFVEYVDIIFQKVLCKKNPFKLRDFS